MTNRLKGNVRLILLVMFISLNVQMSDNLFAFMIVSPQEGESFYEGDTIFVRAKPSPGDPQLIAVSLLASFTQQGCFQLQSQPYECQLTIPLGAPSHGRITAIASVSNAQGLVSQPVNITIKTRANLLGLRVNDDQRTLFLRVGNNRALAIYGQYSGGVERHLEEPESGTTYETSDPKIITVNARGVVSGVAPGKAFITVKNQGKELQIKVQVEPKKE